MNIALIHFLNKNNDSHALILKNLQKAAAENGNQITVVNGNDDFSNVRLSFYEYITVIVPASPFFGAKLPPRLTQLFASCGSTGGKKGCAFVVKSGFSSGKMCRILMAEMEKNGILLDYFDIILDAGHALVSGKKMG